MSEGKPRKKIYKDKIMLIAEKQNEDSKSLGNAEKMLRDILSKYKKARDIKTDGRLSMDDLDKVEMKKGGPVKAGRAAKRGYGIARK